MKEKRLATILYVDITGFSELASQLDPEETTEFVNECFKNIDSIIHIYDGTILRHEGDRVMAAFGFPASLGNDSYCAITSAIKIRDVLKKLDQPIETHIGIATGEILCDNDRIYGYVTETASTLEELASGGEIYIDKNCYELNKTLFDFESVSVDKRHFYRLLSERKSAPQYEGSFADRDDETKTLARFLSASEKIVIVSGEQGIGKTRTIHEARKLLDAEGYQYRFLQTSFLAARSLEFYDAILKIVTELQPNYHIHNDVRLVSESSYNIRLYTDFCSILFNACVEKPLIVLFQYFERIDKNSLEFVKYLINNIEGHNLTLICEMHRLHPSVLDSLKSVAKCTLRTIDLPPLNKAAQSKIISELLSDIEIPQSILNDIVHNSNGNPLFVTEICQYLKTQHSLNLPVQEIQIPFRLKEVMTHLIDHIPVGVFNALSISAMYGYSVSKEFLATAVPNFTETLSYGLQHGLVESNNGEITFTSPFLWEEICNRIPKSTKQELHRKIASILREKSKDHDTDQKLAYHFRECGDYELALHYSLKWAKKLKDLHQNDLALEAYNNAYTLSCELNKKAEYRILLERVELLNLLGMRDLENADIDRLEEITAEEGTNEMTMEVVLCRGRYLESISSYDKAIKLYEGCLKKSREGRVIERLGMAYYSSSRFAKAVDCLNEALTLARNIRDIKHEATIRGHLGVVHWKRGEKEKSLDYSRTALDLFVRLGDNIGQARIIANMGNVHYYMSKYKEALDAYTKAIDVANEIGDVNFQARILTNTGSVYAVMGEYEQSLHHYNQALHIARSTMSKKWEAIIINNIGDIYASVGKYEEALTFFEQALAISEGIGDKGGISIRYGNLGDCYGQLGDYSKALEYLQKAHDIAVEMNTLDWLAFYKNELALALIHSNHLAEAIELTHDAIKIAQKARNISYEINALSTRSLAYLESENVRLAFRNSQKAVNLLTTVETIEGSKSSVFYHHHLVLKKLKKYKEAGEYLEQAYQDIVERGKRISDENFKNSFLSNIQEHRDIIRTWQESQNQK